MNVMNIHTLKNSHFSPAVCDNRSLVCVCVWVCVWVCVCGVCVCVVCVCVWFVCVCVAVQLVSEQGQGSYRKLLLQVSSGCIYLNFYFRYCFKFYHEIILHLTV